MITARELVFYIRAEDQASRVVKRVGKSFGSLNNIKSLEQKSSTQQLKNLNAIDKAQLRIARNNVTLQRAQVQAERLNKLAARGGALKGFTVPQTATLAAAATANVENLNKQEELLVKNLDDVRIAGDAASASIDRQIAESKIEYVNNYANAFGNVARAIRLVGVVAGASLVFAAHQAATFQTQLTLAATQARPTGSGINATLAIQQKLQGVVLKQMQQFPASSSEMANALYEIFSSTNIQSVSKAGDLLKTLNKAAVAGGTDLATMSNAAITLFNNFVVGGKKGGSEFSNLNQALNVFFSAVRFGRMNATQFANSLSYVSGIAKEAGLNFRDIADAMAILTRQTGASRTNQDAQGLARLIQQLSTAADIQGLKKIGVQAVDPLTNKLRPLLPLLAEIKEKANLKGVNALNFFKVIGNNKGTIQAQRAFAYLTGNLQQYQKVAKDVNSDNTEFVKSFEALSKSPGVRWQVVINQMKALVIMIGTQAIPALVQLAQPLIALLHYFDGLSDSTKHTIATIAVFGSAASIIGSTLIIVAGSALKLVNTIKLLKLESLASEVGATSPAIMILVAALAALGYILVEHPKWIEDVSRAMGGFKAILIATGITVGILATGAMLPKLFAAIALIGSSAEVAESKVASLRLSLLALKRLGAIGIAITITEVIIHRHAISQAVSNWLKGHGMGFLAGGGNTNESLKQLVIGAKTDTGLKGDAERNYINKIKQAAAGGDKTAKKIWAMIRAFQANIGTTSNVESMNKVNAAAAQQATRDAIAAAPGKKAKATAAAIISNKTYLKQLKNVAKLQAIYTKTPSLANHNKYFEALAALNAKYNSAMLQSYTSDYLSRVDSADSKSVKTRIQNAKDLATAQVAAAKTAATQVTTILQDATDAYNTLLQQQQSDFGALFAGPFINSPLEQARLGYNNNQVRPADVLRDIKAQVSQYSTFNSQLANLQKRGAPNSLIQQLEQMGPSAPGTPNFIKALTQETPAQWREYMTVYNRGQAAIKANTLTQLNSQLAIYKKFGAQVALAIIAGIKSQDTHLKSELTTILEQLFPNFVDLEKKSKVPKSTTGAKTTGNTTMVTDNSTHDHSTVVHNPIAEDIDTTLAKNAFRNRNKRN